MSEKHDARSKCGPVEVLFLSAMAAVIVVMLMLGDFPSEDRANAAAFEKVMGMTREEWIEQQKETKEPDNE